LKSFSVGLLIKKGKIPAFDDLGKNGGRKKHITVFRGYAKLNEYMHRAVYPLCYSGPIFSLVFAIAREDLQKETIAILRERVLARTTSANP